MKKATKIKLKRLILTTFLLFLSTATLATAVSRSTCPTFGTKSVDTISQTTLLTKSHQQIYITFHYEITLIYIHTHHSSQCRRHDITHHRPEGHTYLINRYYNADRDSFLSPDRYRFVDGATLFTWNLYQYGYANPLVNVDPDGNIPPLTTWIRTQRQIEKIKQEEDEAHRRMLKQIGMTEEMFRGFKERDFHYMGNGIFRRKQMFDLNIMYGIGLFAPEHEIITEWKWEEDGRKLTLKRAWATSENPKGIEAETGIFNILFSAKAIRFGYEAMGIRGALMQGFDQALGLPVTDTFRGATKLANPGFWRAFNRRVLQNESTEASSFFSKFLQDEQGFARIGSQSLTSTDYAQRRLVLNYKFGRTGNLHFDINLRGFSSEVGELSEKSKKLLFSASISDERIVVIGEGMRRVRRFSGQLRKYGFAARTYSPRKWYGGINRLNMNANRSWLRYWSLEKGAPFVSIGRETGRILPASPYFGMELRNLNGNWNFERFAEINPGY